MASVTMQMPPVRPSWSERAATRLGVGRGAVIAAAIALIVGVPSAASVGWTLAAIQLPPQPPRAGFAPLSPTPSPEPVPTPEPEPAPGVAPVPARTHQEPRPSVVVRPRAPLPFTAPPAPVTLAPEPSAPPSPSTSAPVESSTAPTGALDGSAVDPPATVEPSSSAAQLQPGLDE
jgi:hypothetical protein